MGTELHLWPLSVSVLPSVPVLLLILIYPEVPVHGLSGMFVCRADDPWWSYHCLICKFKERNNGV